MPKTKKPTTTKPAPVGRRYLLERLKANIVRACGGDRHSRRDIRYEMHGLKDYDAVIAYAKTKAVDSEAVFREMFNEAKTK